MEYNISKLIEQFLQDKKWVIRPGSSGMNNTTRFVDTEKENYVLRIYQTHKDIEKVKYEHNVLNTLENGNLPFKTPVPVVRKGNKVEKNQKGELLPDTIALTQDGKLAAMFCYIEGTTPDFESREQLYSFGQAVGLLTVALEKVNTALKPVYSPYYMIENTHPNCPLEEVINFCNNPEDKFKQYTHELQKVGDELIKFRESIHKLRKLPHQLIHGDLNASNVLVDKEGKINAVLDFEFVTFDLRVMEAAVCLSEVIKEEQEEKQQWESIKAFITGYGSTVKLNEEEISVIPLLILLRRLDVFIHFLGRYRDGIDDSEVVTGQLVKVVLQSEWLKINQNKLLELFV